MSAVRTNLRLSEECLENLENIQKETSLKSMTAAIEYAAASFSGAVAAQAQQREISRQLDLIKKHINELRRNEYLIIDLLNAMAIEMNISAVPMHHEKQFHSPALASAHDNLSVYLAEVMTRISENEAKKEADDE